MLTLQRPIRLVSSRLQDLWLGISTGGTAPAELPEHAYYATVGYDCTRSVLSKLSLTEQDTFVDVGCGKGRVVCLAAKQGVRQAIGVEYSPTLALHAERNIQELKGKKSFARILCQSAEHTDYSDATVLYFFNPFEAPLLETVLSKIRADRQGAPTRIAFVMESEEQRMVFARSGWTYYERFRDKETHPVSLYRSASH